jgi:hypothetical protein
MGFKEDDPVHLNKDLCSIKTFVPSQINHAATEFELMTNGWFGTTRERIETKNGPQTLTIGLHSARLTVIPCDDSKMPQEGRYKSPSVKWSYQGAKDKISESGLGGSFGGGFNIPFWQFFNAKGEAEASASKSDKASESRQQDAEHEKSEIETASPEDWSIRILNPARPYPHLNGPELEEVILCKIETPKGVASVTAQISISDADIWVDANTRAKSDALGDETNERAVLAALVSKSAQEVASASNIEQEDADRVVIASSTLHRFLDQEDET